MCQTRDVMDVRVPVDIDLSEERLQMLDHGTVVGRIIRRNTKQLIR